MQKRKLRSVLWLSFLLILSTYALETDKLAKYNIDTKEEDNNEFTTGNLNVKINFTTVLESKSNKKFSFEITKIQQKAFDYFLTIQQDYVPDPFSNDPKVFVPEKKGYIRIVQMRGIFFILLSKMLFYAFFLLGIAKVVFGFFSIKSKDYVKQRLSNKRSGKKHNEEGGGGSSKYLMLSLLQCIFVLFLAGLCAMALSANKYSFSNIGRVLSSKNIEVSKSLKEAKDYIARINSEKLRYSADSSDSSDHVFHIRNKIGPLISTLNEHVALARKFTSQILDSTSLTKPATYIFIFCLALFVFFASFFSVKYKRRNITMGLFFLTSFSGCLLIYSAGNHLSSMFMFTDICKQLKEISDPNRTGAGSGGLKNYIGCLNSKFQNEVTGELMNVLVGENSLINLINNQIKVNNKKRVKDDYVKDITSASDAISRRFPNDLDSKYLQARDKFIKLINLTDIVKQKMIDLPTCAYLSDWGKLFYNDICDLGLERSETVISLTVLIAGVLFLMAIFTFFLERFVVDLQEKEKAKNIQLYHRFPSNQEPIYYLND